MINEVWLLNQKISDRALDLLAFGPHPDDVELGLGGTVAKQVSLGYQVGLCDLTRGEMGTNGDVATRMAEAARAGEILGASTRLNAGLPDAGLMPYDNDQAAVVAGIIRRFRPRMIAAPYWEDRHPDHVAASHLITRAWFLAGLAKFEAPGVDGLAPHRPDRIIYYFINNWVQPSFIVDVSAFYSVKLQAMAAHRSQFGDATTVATRLTAPTFLAMIKHRDSVLGNRMGFEYAEGFLVRDHVVVSDLIGGISGIDGSGGGGS